MEYVEIVEEYENGKCVKRTANGIELPITERDPSVHYTHKVRMSKEDFEKAYKISYPQPTLVEKPPTAV